MTDETPNCGDAHERNSSSMSQMEIFIVDLDAAQGALEADEYRTTRLSADEIARFEQKLSVLGVAESHRWRASHIALRMIVERHAGPAARRVSYDIAPGGRPRLSRSLKLTSALEFSLAHAGGVALIAISRQGPIGIDVELPRTIRMSEERRNRIERAATQLASHLQLPTAPDARFLQSWVRLEALAKATGLGIGRILNEARVIGAGQSDGNATQLSYDFGVADISVGVGLYAAVAAPDLPESINLQPFPATVVALNVFLQPDEHH